LNHLNVSMCLRLLFHSTALATFRTCNEKTKVTIPYAMIRGSGICCLLG